MFLLRAGDERRRSALGGGATRFDASARLQAVLAGRYHLFAGCHSVVDDSGAKLEASTFTNPQLPPGWTMQRVPRAQEVPQNTVPPRVVRPNG